MAGRGATYVAMHWRAHADHMRDFAVYDGPGGVVAAVRDELAARVDAMLAAGIAPDRIVLDPGLGFAKRGRAQLAAAPRPRAGAGAGVPAAGRRQPQVVPRTLLAAGGTPRPVGEREHANTALTVLLAQQGVWGLRVHDVRAAQDALRVLERLTLLGGGRRHDRRARRAGIECFGHHGVFEFEKREGQIFVIDLALGIDTAPAAASRRLARHGRLRKSRGLGESRRGEGSGRPDRDPGPADRGRLPLGRPC